MTTINNTFRSKVFKAAWTSIRNGKSENLSIALKSAWNWAKKTLTESKFKVWSPKAGFFRLYIGENYIQISIKERDPKGYYENHRACKGEVFTTAFYKLVGITEEKFEELRSEIYSMFYAELVPSKF